MAVISRTMTLTDKIDRLEPRSKNLARFFVELLNQDTAILTTLPTVEANNLTSHEYKERVLLPTVSRVAAGQGAVPSKSETQNRVTPISIFKSILNIERDAYELGGNGDAYVKSELVAHIAAQDIAVSSDVFYGSNTNPLVIRGLANRYNSLSGNIADNTISAGSITGGDGTSIYITGIGGTGGASFVYPLGSPAFGFERTGDVKWTPVTNGSGEVTWQMFNEFCIRRGLVIPDWRTCARICNIDKSVVSADTTGATINIVNLIIEALGRLPSAQVGKYEDIKIWMNRSVFTALQKQMYNKANAQYTIENIGGKKVSTVMGYEIMVTDSIVNTESTVS